MYGYHGEGLFCNNVSCSEHQTLSCPWELRIPAFVPCPPSTERFLSANHPSCESPVSGAVWRTEIVHADLTSNKIKVRLTAPKGKLTLLVWRRKESFCARFLPDCSLNYSMATEPLLCSSVKEFRRSAEVHQVFGNARQPRKTRAGESKELLSSINQIKVTEGTKNG